MKSITKTLRTSPYLLLKDRYHPPYTIVKADALSVPYGTDRAKNLRLLFKQ
jgi:hypothetical protein